MVKCQRCGSQQIFQVSAKCSDMCQVLRPDKTEWEDGYVPNNLRIIGADFDPDYISFSWCEDCGQMQDQNRE